MNLSPTLSKNSSIVFNVIMIIYLVSMLYSKFLLSVCLILLFLWSFYRLFTEKQSTRLITSFVGSTAFSVISLVFIGVLLSGINSENMADWLHHLKLRLPFLIIPFVFFVFKSEIAKNYYHYILAFIACCFISSIPILIDYIKNTDEIIYKISVGKSFEAPIDHIKYSLFVAFSCISGFILFFSKPTSLVKKYDNAILIVSIFLFVFLHILAVRSGLAVLYGTLFILLIRTAFIGSHRKIALIALLILLIIPAIAIKTIPSLKQKMAYMKYDYEMYLKGEGQNYSDSERLTSYQVGWEIFKSSPVLGVGMGDLLDQSTFHTQKMFNQTSHKYPHNMYLFILSGMGILGFLIFFGAILYPAYYFKSDIETIFLAFNIIILISFLVENTIQRSYSTAFFLFFLLAGVCYMDQKKDRKLRSNLL